MDVFGGISSTRVVVRLKADAFQRSNAARAGVVADANALPRMSVRFRTIAAGWRASNMRRLYLQPFASPALAEKHALDRTFVLEVPSGTNTEAMAAAIAAVNNEVEFATTDVIGGVAGDPLIPNDSFFGLQWGMHNTGQNINQQIGTPGADIHAPESWAIHTGDFGTVTVAVLDSGVNSHPEYGNNVAPYPNGRIVQGTNTVVNGGTTLDNCPHGTHVAGIIAAQGNNGSGVAGVTWGAYIMPVRVLTGCDGNSTDLAEGIIWAADHGADIINMSLQYNLTTPGQIAYVQSAINYAHDERGVLLVGAAGNNNSCGIYYYRCSTGSVNVGAECTSASECQRACIGGANAGGSCSSNGNCPNGTCAFPTCAPYGVCYPAKAANVVGIAATDNRDKFASTSVFDTFTSNFGSEIDVCAPGERIWSTYTNGSYAYLSGTSMATPHVAGLAALVKSYVSELTNDQIAEIIMSTAEDRGPTGWDFRYGFGRINAYEALKAAELWPGVLGSDPPDGAIDARQPLDPTGTIAQGWSEVAITFPRNLGGVASADFAVTQTVAGAAPMVVNVQPIDVDHIRVVLDRPIEPLAWTTITHLPTATRIRLGYLPGDVNHDRTSAPVDILALIDSLNGVGPTLSIWSTDIDRSNLAAPADILQEIDLLNGAGPYAVYNGATLPPMPGP
jgi:subtilisin family serine protease